MGMNIYAEKGYKVVYVNSLNGHIADQAIAEEYLVENKIYTVDYTEVYNWHTDVYLEEFPEIAFNSVLFEDYEEYKTIKACECMFD